VRPCAPLMFPIKNFGAHGAPYLKIKPYPALFPLIDDG